MLDDNSVPEVAQMATNTSPPLSILPTRVNADQPENSHVQEKDLLNTWKMRWCFFWAGIALSALYMVFTIGAGLYVFSISRNFLSLIITAAGTLTIKIMQSFATFLLPLDKRAFKLQKMRIQRRLRDRI